MSDVKDKMTEVIRSQPDDATYEEIMRELAFERMVERGLDDSRSGRVIANDEMERQIRTRRQYGGLKNRTAGFATSTRTSPLITQSRPNRLCLEYTRKLRFS